MKKTMLAAMTAALAIVAPVSSAQSIQVANPAAYLGSWQGQVADLQGGGAAGYKAELTIAQDTRGQLFGSIWYHTYDCGGAWTIVSSGPDGIRMMENIVFTGRGCPARAYVTLSPMPDGTLRLQWSGGPNGPFSAGGALSRR